MTGEEFWVSFFDLRTFGYFVLTSGGFMTPLIIPITFILQAFVIMYQTGRIVRLETMRVI